MVEWAAWYVVSLPRTLRCVTLTSAFIILQDFEKMMVRRTALHPRLADCTDSPIRTQAQMKASGMGGMGGEGGEDGEGSAEAPEEDSDDEGPPPLEAA